MLWFRIKVSSVAVAIVVISIITTLYAALYFTQDRIMATIESDITAECEIAEVLISDKITLLKNNLSMIAAEAERTNQQLLDVLRERISINKDYMSLTFFDKKGLLATQGYPAPGDDFLQTPQALRAFGGDSFISTTQKNSEGEIVFYVCIPAGKDRILVAVLPGPLFSAIVSRFRIWKTGNVFIIDRDGVLIASRPYPNMDLVGERINYIEIGKTDPLHKSVGDFFSVMLQSKKGTGYYDYFGVRRFCAYMPLSGSVNGWVIGVAAPIEESPAASVKRELIYMGTTFLFIGIILAFFASNSIVKPYIKIHEQKRHLEELNENAQNASATKSNFLANMSHEMRTPLNAVIGLSELTLYEEDIPEYARENFVKIYHSSVMLLGIINDILDISKIEAGKFEIIQAEYDVPSLINDTATMNVMRIGDKPIVFNIDVDENLFALLIGDELRLKQIFSNLLSNAFKYTKEGTITWNISTEERDGDTVWLTACTTDTGLGIRPDDLDKLFSDYSQLDTKANRKIEGTGLGLALVKRMLEMMDGTIDVKSEYGKGSAFTVRIPQKFVKDVRIGAGIASNLKQFEYTDAKRTRNAKRTRIRLPYAKVLVVDDVQTNLDVARGMLGPYGMHIDCVLNGPAAIDAIRDEKVIYNAVFMDHMMPGMDGIEATRIIREEIGTEYAKTVPIIALTANAIIGNEEMFLSKGFQAFLSKPIDIKRMDQAIRHWVRDKKLEEEYVTQNPDVENSNDRRKNHDRRKQKDRRHSGQDTVDLVNEWRIDGVDIEKSFERFGYDEEAFLNVFRSYAANTTLLLDKIRSVTEDELPDYAIVVHGIKGSSRGICAETVGDMAELLEHAAKAGDFAFVSEKNAPFIETAEKLLSDLKSKLSGVDAENQKPKADAPDADTLGKLRDACAAYDMDGVDAAMRKLEAYEYKSGQDLVEWLRKSVDAMDLEQVRQRLS